MKKTWLRKTEDNNKVIFEKSPRKQFCQQQSEPETWKESNRSLIASSWNDEWWPGEIDNFTLLRLQAKVKCSSTLTRTTLQVLSSFYFGDKQDLKFSSIELALGHAMKICLFTLLSFFLLLTRSLARVKTWSKIYLEDLTSLLCKVSKMCINKGRLR